MKGRDRDFIRIAAAQLNLTVGDLKGNAEKIIAAAEKAHSAGCSVAAFPELSITGYPPEDLLLRRQFIADQRRVVDEIAAAVRDLVVVVGFVDAQGASLYNSAAVLYEGQVRAVYHKIHLPNYSVFDEERYFERGGAPLVLNLSGFRIGISICEDIWVEDSVAVAEAFAGGAQLLLNISASPYARGKVAQRLELIRRHAQECAAYMIYTNLVGGQDELVFDGCSMYAAPDGEVQAVAAFAEEDLIICDVDPTKVEEKRREDSYRQKAATFKSGLPPCFEVSLPLPRSKVVPPADFSSGSRLPDSEEEEIYRVLLLGLRDYAHKNGFKEVVFGLSGGIDSALVAVLASDALGPTNVHTLTMPSPYSSRGSVEDSRLLAKNLGIELVELPISGIFSAYLELLAASFSGLQPDITEENLQARIRGNLVMAFSNKFSWLALTTGNKSEISVGYCTLYGDTAGGFAPLKDVTKTMVYRLAEYRNLKAGYELIPRSIIEKAPSAELRPNQTDQDSLPPYDLLDQIIRLYVEKSQGVAEIVAAGFDEEIVKKVAQLVDGSEYKRRQAAPGTKITPLAFGKDRRMPITSRYRG